MLNQKEISRLIDKIINNKRLRVATARENHFLFFNIYLSHYVTYETAPFHKEIFDITENEEYTIAVICAFRSSGKSTQMSLSYPLWSIMGNQQKKHILIISKTQDMAKRILGNLKDELTNNELLKSDMGPFRSATSKWGGGTIDLDKYKARIVVASVEEGIRGIRYGTHRPDLIICDDVEDIKSVATQTSRNKTYEWFKGDLIPTGDRNTRTIVIGNLLHEDSLIMRLKKEIEEGKGKGIFKSYPLIDDDGKCLWPGKYPTEKDIEAEKAKLNDDIAWSREYLLKIISDAERVVHPDWLHYYDKLPNQSSGLNNPKLDYVAIAVDWAVSEKDSADYTAILTGIVYGREKDMVIYILPNPINERMVFPTSRKLVEQLYFSWTEQGHNVRLWFDSTSTQLGFGQELRLQGINAEGVTSTGDKRSRIAMTTAMIQTGRVLFPREGAEELIHQLIGFGKERYDDLADAFAMMILKIMENNVLNNDPIMIKGSIMSDNYLSDHKPTKRKRGTLRYDMENSDPHGWGEASKQW